MSPEHEADPKLSFQPLTEGLGFHPFSDGLPYAPAMKTRSEPVTRFSMGEGAQLAGAPRIARDAVRQAARAAALVPDLPARAPAPAPVLADGQYYGVTYLAKRFFAYFVDTAVNTVLCSAGIGLVLWSQGGKAELFLNPGVFLLAVLFLSAFNWALITAQEIAFGTSMGKRLFGLELRGGVIAVFLRALVFIPSAFSGLGILWSLIDPRRRGWHDRAANLQPVEIARL